MFGLLRDGQRTQSSLVVLYVRMRFNPIKKCLFQIGHSMSVCLLYALKKTLNFREGRQEDSRNSESPRRPLVFVYVRRTQRAQLRKK